jgi:hypothetical protein
VPGGTTAYHRGGECGSGGGDLFRLLQPGRQGDAEDGAHHRRQHQPHLTRDHVQSGELVADREHQRRAGERAVHFDNFDGFSGVANSGAGDAKIHVSKDVYTITGTAAGSRLNDSRVSLTEPFKIDVSC